VTEDSRGEAGGNDQSPAVTPPAVASAAATTEAPGRGGSDEKASASVQESALSTTLPPAGVENGPKVGGEAGKPAAAGAKPEAAAGAAMDDSRTNHRGSSRALAKLSTTAPASVASKSDSVTKPDDARVRKLVSRTMVARSAESARRADPPKGETGHRSRKSSDDERAARIGPPPIIYAPGPEATVPQGVDLVDGMKRRSLAAITGSWQRVVNAPGAALNRGKQALYGILDSVW